MIIVSDALIAKKVRVAVSLIYLPIRLTRTRASYIRGRGGS